MLLLLSSCLLQDPSRTDRRDIKSNESHVCHLFFTDADTEHKVVAPSIRVFLGKFIS